MAEYNIGDIIYQLFAWLVPISFIVISVLTWRSFKKRQTQLDSMKEKLDALEKKLEATERGGRTDGRS